MTKASSHQTRAHHEARGVCSGEFARVSGLPLDVDKDGRGID